MNSANSLSPITFEIISNSMVAINDEAGATVRFVSGSPVATDVFDYNTGLLTAEGEVFATGVYISIHAISLEHIVKDILREYRENPGIGDDDMFLCNDPYVGAQHQNDVALVAPIHYHGQLIAWTGVAIHQLDVGGPGKGQVSVGASSIYEEAPPVPPVKIVERGVLRKDIEREYLRRSRTPEIVGLDLRAMIASNNVSSKRIRQLAETHGLEALQETMRRTIAFADRALKSKLKDIPDATWRHIGYLDYEGKTYPCHLALSKRQDKLVFDFTGTAAQAPAVINCTRVGLQAGVLCAILAYLCYDAPWCPSGVMRSVEIVSEPGTVFDARWPAGTSKATTAANWEVIDLSSLCLANMLNSSPRFRSQLMAPWKSFSITEDLFGVDQRGQSFATFLSDFMAGGGGARSFKDGIDTGGFLSSVACAVANAEVNEYYYPIMYLYRRQAADTGGPGKFRGGASIETMYIAHDVPQIPFKIVHVLGVEQSQPAGIQGGYPGSTNQVVLKRGTNVHPLLASGKLPATLGQIAGKLEVPPAIAVTHMKRDDVYAALGSGGSGFGDPLERDPGRVAVDVVSGLVSVEQARKTYGVTLSGSDVDPDQTALQRQRLKGERTRWRKGKEFARRVSGKDQEPLQEISEYLSAVRCDGQVLIRCRCGHVLCDAGENYKEYAMFDEGPLQRAGPNMDPHRTGRDKFVFRRYCCPACYTLLESEIALKGAPVLWSYVTGDTVV